MIKKINLFLKIFSIIFFIILNEKSFSKDIFEIKAEKVSFDNSKNLIIAEGDASAENQFGKRINSDKILYYKKKGLIKTSGNSKYTHNLNFLKANDFLYNINTKNLIANKNVLFEDKMNNKFYFDNFEFNEISQIGSGTNIRVKSKDGSYLQSKRGYFDKNKNIIKLHNGKFTTCLNFKNKKNEFCPSWSLNSKEIIHDKENKLIKHKHALLKIKKIPILYTPYVSHPDPSVKRQSGLLPPLIKTLSDIGRTIEIPYFWAIDKDKDLTFAPVYYFDENNLYKASYRQIFKNSFLNIESGYSEGYKKFHRIGRTQGSRNYLFAEYNKNISNVILNDDKITFKLQRISQENFIRVNKINTNLFKEDLRNLENSFHILSTGDRKQIIFKAGIFENLDIHDNSKYTYYLPDGVFSYNTNIKNFNTNLNSYYQAQKFSQNQKQAKIRNTLSLDSRKFIFKDKGISSVLKFNFQNNNIYNDNVIAQKDNANFNNYLTFAIDNDMPFAKLNKYSYQILSPRVFLKYTTGKMKNAINDGKIMNYTDIYSMNRTNNLDTPEVGGSLGYGFNYNYAKQKIDSFENSKKLNLGLGQVFKSSTENLMPNSSSLRNKSSDFVGYLEYSVYGDKVDLLIENQNKINFLRDFEKNFLSINYTYNIENDFSEFSNNNFELKGSYNKLFTAIKFNEKNNHVGSDRNGTINIKKLFKDNYYFNFETKRNLKKSGSEYLRYGINFENDCMIASISFSKDFYFDKDISASNTLILGVVFKPFSDNFAPDLSNFIK